MSLTEISLVVIAVSFLVLVLTVLPTVIAIKRTATSIGSLSDMVQAELKPTIQELTAVLAQLKTVGGSVSEHIDEMAQFVAALGETGHNLHTINRSMSVVTGALTTSSAWLSGAKVAARYVLKRNLKKKGGI